jgi:hypothetical protein
MGTGLFTFSTAIAICLVLLMEYDRPFVPGGFVLSPADYRDAIRDWRKRKFRLRIGLRTIRIPRRTHIAKTQRGAGAAAHPCLVFQASRLRNAAEIAGLRSAFAPVWQREVLGRAHFMQTRGGAREFERLRAFA